MNILDENVLESQRQRLLRWGIPFRQIGIDLGRKGMNDEQIIPLLLTLRQPTIFTLDRDFFKRDLCHARYGIAYLDVPDNEAARLIRRVLRHPQFNTHAKRMGVVIRASNAGLYVWRLGREREAYFDWIE